MSVETNEGDMIFWSAIFLLILINSWFVNYLYNEWLNLDYVIVGSILIFSILILFCGLIGRNHSIKRKHKYG